MPSTEIMWCKWRTQGICTGFVFIQVTEDQGQSPVMFSGSIIHQFLPQALSMQIYITMQASVRLHLLTQPSVTKGGKLSREGTCVLVMGKEV